MSQIKVFLTLSLVLALVDHKMSVSIFKLFDKYIGDKPHKYCDIHIVYAFTSTIQWFVVICIQDQKVANISRRYINVRLQHKLFNEKKSVLDGVI